VPRSRSAVPAWLRRHYGVSLPLPLPQGASLAAWERLRSTPKVEGLDLAVERARLWLDAHAGEIEAGLAWRRWRREAGRSVADRFALPARLAKLIKERRPVPHRRTEALAAFVLNLKVENPQLPAQALAVISWWAGFGPRPGADGGRALRRLMERHRW